MVMATWAWDKHHGCHALFSKGSATLKHVTKTLTKNISFSKILFASFHMMQEASERYMKHFSICNIKGAENFPGAFLSIYFKVSLLSSTMLALFLSCSFIDLKFFSFLLIY